MNPTHSGYLDDLASELGNTSACPCKKPWLEAHWPKHLAAAVALCRQVRAKYVFSGQCPPALERRQGRLQRRRCAHEASFTFGSIQTYCYAFAPISNT